MLFQLYSINPYRPNPGQSEQIKLNFYFHTSFWFYEGLSEMIGSLRVNTEQVRSPVVPTGKIWGEVFKNGPSKNLWKTAFKKSEVIRLSSTNFTWSILEYFVPYVFKVSN